MAKKKDSSPPVKEPKTEVSPLILEQIEARMVPIATIHLSGKNARKDVGDLTELVQSIQSVGILQPLVVRPLEAPDQYELIAGERRLMAANQAGCADVPVIVRQVDDSTADAMRAIENLQRVNLSEIESAHDIKRLHEQAVAGGSKSPTQDVAKQIGKSPSHVLQRIQLLKLSAKALEKFLAGGFSATNAVEIARLPKKMQDALIQQSAWQLREPVSEFKRYLEQNVTLPIAKAPFDHSDASLCPKAGACDRCPKNTTNYQPEDGEEKPTAGRCLDAECWQAKQIAHKKRERAKIEQELGMKLTTVSTNRYDRAGAKYGAEGYRTAKEGAEGAVPAEIVQTDYHDKKRMGEIVWIVPVDAKDRAAEQKRKDEALMRRSRIAKSLTDTLREKVAARWPSEPGSVLMHLVLGRKILGMGYAAWEQHFKELGIAAAPPKKKSGYGHDEKACQMLLLEQLAKAPTKDLGKWVWELFFREDFRSADYYACTPDLRAAIHAANQLGIDTAAVKAEIEAKHPKPEGDKPKGRKGKPADPLAAPEPEEKPEEQEKGAPVVDEAPPAPTGGPTTEEASKVPAEPPSLEVVEGGEGSTEPESHSAPVPEPPSTDAPQSIAGLCRLCACTDEETTDLCQYVIAGGCTWAEPDLCTSCQRLLSVGLTEDQVKDFANRFEEDWSDADDALLDRALDMLGPDGSPKGTIADPAPLPWDGEVELSAEVSASYRLFEADGKHYLEFLTSRHADANPERFECTDDEFAAAKADPAKVIGECLEDLKEEAEIAEEIEMPNLAEAAALEEMEKEKASAAEDHSEAVDYQPYDEGERRFLAQFHRAKGHDAGYVVLFEIANKKPLHGGAARKLADGGEYVSKELYRAEAPSADAGYGLVDKWFESHKETAHV